MNPRCDILISRLYFRGGMFKQVLFQGIEECSRVIVLQTHDTPSVCAKEGIYMYCRYTHYFAMLFGKCIRKRIAKGTCSSHFSFPY